jgi:beta-lactamase class A
MTLGVYVRNLNNGPWFGINENEYYSPASLMKVPVLITYLKWIELDPTIWDKKILLEDDGLNTTQYYQSTKKLPTGKEYSVRELLEEMIIYSDNRSMVALMKAIPIDIYVRVNTDLGITVPGAKTPENYLSVKEVATFFRILYNASYLDRSSSEYALELLSRVTFDSGLRA